MAWLHWSLFACVTAAGAPSRPPPNVAPDPPPPPPAVVDGCTVTVVGLPVPARAHHWLELSGGRVRLGGDALQLRLEQVEMVVQLSGPRYTGHLRLPPKACTGGTTHVLVAKPRPATISFEGPKDLVLRCDAGPDGFAGKWRIARKLGPLDVGQGLATACEFKSPGFRPLRQHMSLQPGDNRVIVAMVPLGE